MFRSPEDSASTVVITFGTHVLALHRRTGAVVWRWESDDPTESFVRLAFPAHRVVVASGKGLVCFVLMTGQLVWRSQAPVYAETLWHEGEEIVVASAGEVAGIDAKDGHVLWHHPFKGMGRGHVAIGAPGNVAQVDREGG